MLTYNIIYSTHIDPCKMAGRGKNGRNVQYTVQDEPAFIKRFKEKAGYKDEPGIEAKVLA